MQYCAQWFLRLLSGLFLASMIGCPNRADYPPLETRVQGRAPLNAGGKFRIFEDAGKRIVEAEGDIDQAGNFTANLHWAGDGPQLIEVEGGSYVEPATQTVAHHDGQMLRTVVELLKPGSDNKPIESIDATVTPWTEIAHAKGGEAGFADVLAVMTDALGCQSGDYARLLRVRPAAPSEDRPVQNLSPEALSYVYLGALSQLASDLSEQFGLQPGARLTTMGLTKAIAADYADGRIDGYAAGARIWLTDDHSLPADVLRQPLAQAALKFLRGPGNKSGLREAAALDVLRCVSKGANLQLGPVGEELDTEGPVVAAVAPAAATYVAGAQEVICNATDTSTVATIQGALLHGGQAIAGLGQAATLLYDEGARKQWRAPMLVADLDSGPLVVRCDANDKWGNSSSVSHDFDFNKGKVAPGLSFPGSSAERLSGTIQVVCDCSADMYSHRCEILPIGEDEAHPALSCREGPQRSECSWETTGVLDGSHVVTCANWTRGLDRPLTASLAARVKNHQEGTAEGTVYLDTPVEHVTVTARAYEGGLPGRVLGAGDAADGTFRFSLSTEYRGPILIEAVPSQTSKEQSRYRNVPLDAMMAFSNGRLSLLLEHYEPGQSLTGLSINVLSSMAESLATARWHRRINDPGSFYDAATAAQRLVEQYLQPTKPFDPRFTRVANLGVSDRVADHDPEVMGLYHVGLSRLAVEYSAEHCSGTSCITTADLVEAMRQDLSDGVLDGKNRDGFKVRLGYLALLKEDFFRIELSRGIRRWLDKAAFVGIRHEAVNKSGLNRETFMGHEQLLQTLAAQDSSLFGHRPGAHYDEDGPRLDIALLSTEGEALSLDSALGKMRFRVVVDGTDDSGVAWIRASVNGEELKSVRSLRPDHAEYWIDTRDFPDGDVQIVFEAQDGQGNRSVPRFVYLTIDKLEPTVEIKEREVWITNGAMHYLAASVSKPNLSGQIFNDSLPLGEPWRVPQGSTYFTVPAPVECNAHHVLTVRVRDAAGNTGEARQVVHCDSMPPSLTPQPSPFVQEKSGQTVDLAPRLHAQGQPIDLQPSSGALVLEKIWSRLDNIPEHSPMTMRFSVSDVAPDAAGIGTPVDHLRVSYKYIFQGSGAAREREWAPVTCRDGQCEVVFSYPTMLPEEVVGLPVTVARIQNFIARSGPNDLHSVLVKVEDLAGNTTTAEWTFHLQLYTPPVEVDCNWHPSLVAARLAGNPSVPSAARDGFAPLYVNIGAALATSGSSLTPQDAVHYFSFGDTGVEWRLDRGIGQVSVVSQDKVGVPNYDHCSTQGRWMEFYDDGACNESMWRLQHPRLWEWRRNAGDGTLAGTQGVRPMHRTVELRPGAEQVHNPLFASGVPKRSDGAALRLDPTISINATHETQASQRFGYTYNSTGNTKKRGKRIEEKMFVKDMRIIRHGAYMPSHTGSSPGTPAPVAVNYAPGCSADLTASWREDRAPVVHAGPAPSFEDISTNYGP